MNATEPLSALVAQLRSQLARRPMAYTMTLLPHDISRLLSAVEAGGALAAAAHASVSASHLTHEEAWLRAALAKWEEANRGT